jgi:hypothetical protein
MTGVIILFFRVFGSGIRENDTGNMIRISLLKFSKQYARDGIRTQELLRDQALNLAPLTWLGYPRACIDYPPDLINVGGNYFFLPVAISA